MLNTVLTRLTELGGGISLWVYIAIGKKCIGCEQESGKN